MRKQTFAVDFDGTLCDNAWPNIGEPYHDIIDWMKNLREEGHKVILWTCRGGEKLAEAVKWCEEHGLFFDAVNDNLEEHKLKFGENSRKVCADYYIDDKAIYPTDMSHVIKLPIFSDDQDEYNPTEMWR